MKKHVSFCGSEKLPHSLPMKNSQESCGSGILLNVRGNGKLCIRSSGPGSNENNEVDIDIVLHIKNQSVPITLLLPHAKTRLEINGDGDIQFAIKETEGVKNGTGSDDKFNQLSTEKIIMTHGNDDKLNKSKKTHRRNNSDFLQISGSDSSATDDDQARQADNDNEKNSGVENSMLFSDDSGISSAFTTGCCICSNYSDTCSNCANVAAQNKEDPPKTCVNNEDDIELQTKDIILDCDQLHYMDSGSMPECSGKSDTMQKTFRKHANSDSWDNTSIVCLRDPIRKSYTYLLDVLDLLDLCDHLYENYVLEMDLYRKLFEMCYEQRHIRNAKRSLLLHLSTRAVNQDKMINALHGSAQYQLIPYFYPEVRI